LIGAILTPILDNTNSEVAWGFSFFFKWLSNPILNTVVLIAAGLAALGGSRVDFRRGALFVEAGSGMSALTLGVVVWTNSGWFDASGNVRDDLAQHESLHTRTVAALGWAGFYLTYITIGGIWGAIESGSAGCWFAINSQGEGNPFEKEASTHVAGSC
jgi:hypothetical protein